MKKLLLASVLLALGFSDAKAANYTIPQWSSTGAAATGASCVPSGNSLAIPIPAGTVIFTCTVAPVAWVPGVASSNESNLTIGTYTSGGGVTASTFTLVTVAAVTTVQTFPANSGTITP
jgi:hypothetical protein